MSRAENLASILRRAFCVPNENRLSAKNFSFFSRIYNTDYNVHRGEWSIKTLKLLKLV